jgi:hypothetical protein
MEEVARSMLRREGGAKAVAERTRREADARAEDDVRNFMVKYGQSLSVGVLRNSGSNSYLYDVLTGLFVGL